MLYKALYGLKQEPRAWYEWQWDFLFIQGFKIWMVYTTLFTKVINGDLFVYQIYVDDVIFGSTSDDFCKGFGDMMTKVFKMSMIGELNFFLNFEVKHLEERTFIPRF